MFFLFKQKAAYEMRISDWSSDVCSSDLVAHQRNLAPAAEGEAVDRGDDRLRDRMRDHAGKAPGLLLGIGRHKAFAARQRDEIGARAETLVARTGDDDGTDFGVVFGGFARGADTGMDRRIDGIARLGPLDRDDQEL